MMQQEFETMIGKEVDYETFRIYEEMYLAAPESITKQKFVAMLNIDAIPESEAAKERKAKAEEFKKTIQGKIENLKSKISDYNEFLQSSIYRLQNFGPDYEAAAKNEIKTWRNAIKRAKAEISCLKAIVA